ncbi:helix-turn-helix domain-containing protein [Clostridium sp. MCC353]|uniref:IclR family transcriptional regulator n=1 Tax=Clostridium sp. MCC353 TaxID=2592646 RepID=UPI001C031CEA|nr:IclR family transcriptional regulator [Clostridium sp. MCC353]MBT9777597.1 helix-turn-helix domain-containing protein [Clostridium sp. MCC353]
MQKKESNSSQQSIERALKLLTIMGDSRTAMNVTEISKILNISRSTAYAMVNVMTEMNFLSKDQSTGKYFLGYQIFILGSRFRIKYSHLLSCDDYLKAFVKQTAVQLNQANLMALQQDYMVLKFLSKTTSTAINQFADQRIVPAFCTAGGKVLLASLSEEEQKTALDQHPLHAYTASTITDRDKILQQLKEISSQGYGVDIEEFTNFEVSLAAPLKDYSGKTVAAVSLSVPNLIYQNRYQEYIQLVVALGRELSSLLGYRDTF